MHIMYEENIHNTCANTYMYGQRAITDKKTNKHTSYTYIHT